MDRDFEVRTKNRSFGERWAARVAWEVYVYILVLPTSLLTAAECG